jgi:hypothetical protein
MQREMDRIKALEEQFACDHCKDRTLEEQIALGYIEKISESTYCSTVKAQRVHDKAFRDLAKAMLITI